MEKNFAKQDNINLPTKTKVMMVIAIDESGDFSPTSNKHSFFVAAIIDHYENGIEKKQKQFLEWFNSIPIKRRNEKNEIKGSELLDHELLSFVTKVCCVEPKVICEIVNFQPKNNPEVLIKRFKNLAIVRINRTLKLAKNEWKVTRKTMKLYDGLVPWYKNAKKMNYQHYSKLILLQKVIVKAYTKAKKIFDANNTSNTETFEKSLAIKIDKDFITGPQSKQYFKELLAISLLTKLTTEPLHKSDFLNFRSFVDSKVDFFESYLNFEIQIADIIGIIINRFFNADKPFEAFKVLDQDKDRLMQITEIVFNPNPDESNIEPSTLT